MPKSKYSALAEKSANAIQNEKLKISFEFLDMDTEEFFIHGLTSDFYKHFFECLTVIKQSVDTDISQQTHSALIPKSIFHQKGTKNKFPDHVIDKLSSKLRVETDDKELAKQKAVELTTRRAFELRITKASGRLHGFLWNNIFNIVWVDPAHNLYPLEKFGIRKQENYATVKCCSVEEL